MSYADKPLPSKSEMLATTIRDKQGKLQITALHLVNQAGLVECDCFLTPATTIFIKKAKIDHKTRVFLCGKNKERKLNEDSRQPHG